MSSPNLKLSFSLISLLISSQFTGVFLFLSLLFAALCGVVHIFFSSSLILALLAVLYRVDSAWLLHMFCPASVPGTAHYTLAVLFFLVPYLA